MTSRRTQENIEAAAASDPIVPIDFTPPEQRKRGVRLQLSPGRFALGAILLLFAAAAWFVLTAKSVFIDVSPIDSRIDVHHPLAVRIGPRYLLRPGKVEVSIRAAGYHSLETTLEITEQQAQTFPLELSKLPGFLNLSTTPVPGARVLIDGEEAGTTPLEAVELAAGEHILTLEKARYQSSETIVNIEGRATQQDLAVELLPAWAELSLVTHPAGARVFVDGEEIGQTPLSAQVLQGERQILVKLSAHKAWSDKLLIRPMQDIALPLIELQAADGLVLLQSTPDNAGVLLNGNYQGQTPLEISVAPDAEHELVFLRNGYREAQRSLRLGPDQEASVQVELEPITHPVTIRAEPADAELLINGKSIGPANQTVELLAASQEIEIRHPGYVPFTTTFVSRPGLEQKLEVSLKTLEQQRLESIKPVITSAAGQTLRLLYPAAFTMGASRREAGRQANEILREVELTRPFYLAETEVTNAQFQQFAPDHSSGVVQGQNITLSNNAQPVVRVSWTQAALYCNWLSQQESLPPFYQVVDGKVVGINAGSHGYRLPTEAEWAWAARVESGNPDKLLKFPWGDQLPPPENHGNYADLSAAALLNRILSEYNDSFPASAPVASFPANANGFYDMGGNAAEWTHDYYGSTGTFGSSTEADPTGPGEGRYHVIRGSSWAHGSVTDLRLSYRDYGDEPRDDVGFRIARYLEE